ARRAFTASAPRRAKLGLEGLAKKVDLSKARVLIRLDLNVPLSKQDGVTITDDTRLRAVVPTMAFLKKHGAQVVIATHVGRPKDAPDPKYSVSPVVKRLSELLGTDVQTCGDCIGEDVSTAAAKLAPGGVLLLENVRFHKGETKNHAEFAEALAKSSGATCYVNDAFGAAHRAHASTEGVVKFIDGPAAAGFLMEKELQYIQGAVDDPKRPFTAILGGAKVSSKIPVIESMIDKCDTILIGGGMIFTFYKAMGLSIGASMVEEDLVDTARNLIAKAKAKGVKLLLPTDVVVADKFAADAEAKVVSVDSIPDGWLGLDVGPATSQVFADVVKASKTIVWNGPMGVFEFEKFAKGTFAVATAMANVDADAITIIGGGDSVAAVELAGLAGKMSHISTGGGASLELLEGKVLPGVAALNEA
ncbi:phosphoglycerate kinase, partial [Pelagophyceae sp. CCMP2097]